MRSFFKTILAPAPVLTLCLALLGTIPAATPANASWWNPFSWWSTPATCSFAPDTQVLMGDGSLRPIASLNIGDVVASRSEETGLYAKRAVTGTFSKLHQDKVILHLASADGTKESIVTTTEHPFHVRGKGFVPAGKLKPGMALSAHHANAPARLLLSANQSQSPALVVENVEIQQKGANFRAYNLSIAKDHTFFIGNSKVWVHNDCLTVNGVSVKVSPETLWNLEDFSSSQMDGSLSVPYFNVVKTTYGYLRIADKTFYIKRSAGYPGKKLKEDANVPTNAYSWEHVEGHTAALMRYGKVKKATVYINNRRGPCQGCRGNLKSLLPRGYSLKVVWRNLQGRIQQRTITGE